MTNIDTGETVEIKAPKAKGQTSATSNVHQDIAAELDALAVKPEPAQTAAQIERHRRVGVSREEFAGVVETLSALAEGTERPGALLGALRNLRIARDKMISAIEGVPDNVIAPDGGA